MASVQITGVLKDPIDNLSPNTPIRVSTLVGFGDTLTSAVAVYNTNAQAVYDFNLVYGYHRIEVRYDDKFVKIGDIGIGEGLTGPLTISQLLQLTVPPSDPTLVEMNRILNEVNKSAIQVAEDSKIAADAETAITPMFNYFNANYPTFETNYDDFAEKYPDFTLKYNQVVTLAGQTETNAKLAKDWAVGPSVSGTTPSDTNNAKYWADQAQYNANQTFISGGLFTPTVLAEYPDVTSVVRDTIWIIEFDAAGEFYQYTTGPFTGKVVKTGDMIFYDTPSNTWTLLPTSVSGGSGVLTVDGDSGPNVNLESKYFWNGNKPTIGDVVNLQQLLDAKADKTYVDTELGKKADKTYVDTELGKKAELDGGVVVPRWTTVTRPDTTSVTKALIGFNDTLQEFESWNPLTLKWGSIGATGIVRDVLYDGDIVPHLQTVTLDYPVTDYDEIHIYYNWGTPGESRDTLTSAVIGVDELLDKRYVTTANSVFTNTTGTYRGAQRILARDSTPSLLKVTTETSGFIAVQCGVVKVIGIKYN